MSKVKVLSNNIFPPGICDEIYLIVTFTVSNVKKLNRKEHEFQKELRRGKHQTTSEKQILFFKTEMPTPIFLSNTNRTNVRQMKREIDVLLDTYKLKQEFKHDKLFLMAIKSCVKREWKTTHNFLKYFLTFHI